MFLFVASFFSPFSSNVAFECTLLILGGEIVRYSRTSTRAGSTLLQLDELRGLGLIIYSQKQPNSQGLKPQIQTQISDRALQLLTVLSHIHQSPSAKTTRKTGSSTEQVWCFFFIFCFPFRLFYTAVSLSSNL